MANSRVNLPALAEHVEALGYLCVFFAALEVQVNDLIGQMTKLEGDTLGCVTNQTDFLKKLKVAEGLGFIAKPCDQWFDDLHIALRAVENKIMPRRNRFVHDRWTVGDEGAIRRYFRTRITSPSSKKPREISTSETFPTTAEEIWLLFDELIHLCGAFDILADDLKHGRKSSSLPQSLREQLSERQTPPRAKTEKARASPPPKKRG